MTAITCQRPNCTGAIVDGICEDCGRPPVGKSLLATVASSSTTAANTASVATASARTGTQATSASTRTGSRRSTSRSSTRGSSSRRQALGGGLVSLPPQASQDPLKLLMANPEVPERKRRCPGCDAKVNRTKGFCPECGAEYNFMPSLQAGDLVNGKFEVKGPIAFGGLGWIYLAWDNGLGRWVVLKGLLNAKDEASAQAAVAERQFLAAVKHPKIVGIYDFINHGGEGFIVMEYVGGRTIDSMWKERTTLPVEEAIAYVLGILPAFSYLHSHGFVYCDFKPDNFMLEEDDVKLIDMGGVRRIDDPNGDIFGTKGYMAPEASDDPVVVSDLYTVGRTLAVLIMQFKYQTTFEHSLPTPTEQPVLAEHDALYRFLLRATHQDPDQRFQSADEMADQLYGVLREIVALKGDPKPAESRVFTSDNLLDADDEEGTLKPLLRLLPTLKMDANDPAANELLRLAAVIDPVKRLKALHQLAGKMKLSVEARLRHADALVAVGDAKSAYAILQQLEQEDPFDWRVNWYRGKASIASGQYTEASVAFDKVYFEMPGEAAPKLAMAFAAEAAGNIDNAQRLYQRVVKLDPSYTSACFGLARCMRAKGHLADAVTALGAVSANHSMYTQAKIASARLMLGAGPQFDDNLLDQTAAAIEAISQDGGLVHQLAARLLSQALTLVNRGVTKEDGKRKLLGHSVSIGSLRAAAEQEYRQAGRFAQSIEEKIQWIDLANRVRPRTLF
jgi:serine/threonine-protein kinase PknG